MQTIERLFHRFQAFAGTGPAPGSLALRDLTEAVLAARPALRCDLPIRYRPEMWVKDGGGLWRKRRDGERYIPGS